MSRRKQPSPPPAPRTDPLRWIVAGAALVGWGAALAVIAGRAEKSDVPAVARDGRSPGINLNFGPTISNKTPAPGPPPEGMVWIPGGEFSMGSDSTGESPSRPGDAVPPDAQPVHRVYVDAFWMDATEVTNEEFEKFVNATGYKTVAEIRPAPQEFPTVAPGDLVAGSHVFTATAWPADPDDDRQWWRFVPGADWRHPTGPDSSIQDRGNYPVVQIAYGDAAAYAKWAGKRLPTEAEWEFAARGGVAGKRYVWGNALKPGEKFQANFYQGDFPAEGGDTGEDGFKGLAPAAQYAPNPYGLYDMAGNVQEWCGDWCRPDTYARLKARGGVARNPQGPSTSYDPAAPGAKKRVQRGGSFLCTDQHPTRCMVGTRDSGEVRTAGNHVGFRCVKVNVQGN